MGSGLPLVRSAHGLSHLEYDWELPIRRPLLLNLARDNLLIRYDPRGSGLSDWDVGEISLDAWVNDMETVVNAVGLHRFPIIAFSQGYAVSIARVSHLVLYGGFAVGTNKQPNCTVLDRERVSALKTLIRLGWGTDDPMLRQVFTSSQLPVATREQADAYNEVQRLSASPECAVRYLETVVDIDVRDPSLRSRRQLSFSMFARTAAFRSPWAGRSRQGYRMRDLLPCRGRATCYWSAIRGWSRSSTSCGHSCAGQFSCRPTNVRFFVAEGRWLR